MRPIHQNVPRLLAALGILVAVGGSVAVAPALTMLLVAAGLGLAVLGLTPRPFLTVVLLILIIQEPLQVLAGGAAWARYLDEFLILVAGSAVVVFDPKVRQALSVKWIALPVAACYLGMLLSSAVAHTPLLPAAVDLLLLSKPFLLFCIGVSLAPAGEEVDRNVHRFLVAIGCVLALAIPFLLFPGLYQTYSGELSRPHERLGTISAQGFFLGPGALSWFAAATFAFCYAAYLAYQRTLYLWYGLCSIGFVLLTFRRKSILAVAAVVGLSLFLKNTKSGRLRATAVTGILVLVAATFLAPYIGALWDRTLTEYVHADPYATARSGLYYTSLLIARDHFPLGSGLASFGSHASHMFGSETYNEYDMARLLGISGLEFRFVTDTFWPMVLGQGGVVSFVGYVAFFVVLMLAAWRTGEATEATDSQSFLAYSALFLIVASLCESVASHIYGSSMHAALVMVPAGVLWRLTTAMNKERSRAIPMAAARISGPHQAGR